MRAASREGVDSYMACGREKRARTGLRRELGELRGRAKEVPDYERENKLVGLRKSADGMIGRSMRQDWAKGRFKRGGKRRVRGGTALLRKCLLHDS